MPYTVVASRMEVEQEKEDHVCWVSQGRLSEEAYSGRQIHFREDEQLRKGVEA